MRIRIGLLVQLKSMWSIIDIIQLARRLGSAWSWGVSEGGVEGNNTYQIVYKGASGVAMDGAWGCRA